MVLALMKKTTRHKERAASRSGTLVLLPVAPSLLHVYWRLGGQGEAGESGRPLWLRFHEGSEGSAALVRAAEGPSGKCYVTLPPDREYRAEAGWLDEGGHFRRLAQSNLVKTLKPPLEEIAESLPPRPLPPASALSAQAGKGEPFWSAVVAGLRAESAALGRLESEAPSSGAPLERGGDTPSSPAARLDLTTICEAKFRGGSSSRNW